MITVIYGDRASGKSTLVQAIHDLTLASSVEVDSFKECLVVCDKIKCQHYNKDSIVILNEYPTLKQVKELYAKFDRVISININKRSLN